MINLGILYSNEGQSELVGYSDADWGGDINDRKSTSGYLFKVSGGEISWRSKKQTCVALSTADAELSAAAQESLRLMQLTSELTISSDSPTIIFEDNQSAIAMTHNPQFHGRSKHIVCSETRGLKKHQTSILS